MPFIKLIASQNQHNFQQRLETASDNDCHTYYHMSHSIIAFKATGDQGLQQYYGHNRRVYLNIAYFNKINLSPDSNKQHLENYRLRYGDAPTLLLQPCIYFMYLNYNCYCCYVRKEVINLMQYSCNVTQPEMKTDSKNTKLMLDKRVSQLLGVFQ